MKKKNGKNVYEKKVTLGRDENGIPVRKSITGRTIAELNDKIEMAKENFQRLIGRDNSVLFSSYARRWLQTTKAVKSINTRLMYENALEKHIIPEVGDLYFDEITLSDLQGIINKRAEHYETCNKIRLTLRQIFTAAQDEGIKSDVKAGKLVLPPKIKNEKRALTKDEKKAIFDCDTWTEEMKVFVHLLFYTGIRREEALALTPQDLDFISNEVTINKTLIFDHNAPILQKMTKSSASTRKVPLPAVFLPELASYADGKKILFPAPRFKRDEYMSQSSYVKFWAGIIRHLTPLAPTAKDLTAHIFRHNYATILHYSGISIKKAAQIMGHSNTQMIMEVYAHLDDQKERTAEKLDAAFTQ